MSIKVAGDEATGHGCTLADHESLDGKIRPHWHCSQAGCLVLHETEEAANGCGKAEAKS